MKLSPALFEERVTVPTLLALIRVSEVVDETSTPFLAKPFSSTKIYPDSMTSDDEFELTPNTIHHIRQARGESTTEFSNEVGVVTRTVQKWESGDSQPAPEYRTAIRDLVPDDVTLDEFDEGVLWSHQLPPGEQRLYGSTKLQTLHERPRTSTELDGINSLSSAQRQFVEWLTVTGAQGSSKRTPDVDTVFYLAGDDRRAVWRFIEVNEEFVAEALSTRSNKLSSEWDEFHYALIRDE